MGSRVKQFTLKGCHVVPQLLNISFLGFLTEALRVTKTGNMFCLLPLLLVFSPAQPQPEYPSQPQNYQGQGYMSGNTGGWDDGDGYGPLAKGCAIMVKQGKINVCVRYEDVNYYFWKAKGVYDLDGILDKTIEDASSNQGASTSGYSGYSSSGTKDAKYLSILGKVLETTTKALGEKYKLDKYAVQQILPQINTMKTKINKFCPQFLKYQSCYSVANSRYSQLDGSCNNLRNPNYGETYTPFKRFLLPDYSDNVSEVKAPKSGNPLDFANSRKICTEVHQDQRKDDYKVTSFFVAFGQIVIHDTMMFRSDRFDCCAKSSPMPQMSEQCAATSLVKDYFYHTLHKKTCLGFTRSQSAVTRGCRLGPRQQLNRQSAGLDASYIYAQDKDKMDRLRDTDGKLEVKEGPQFSVCKDGATSKGILKSIENPSDTQNIEDFNIALEVDPEEPCKGLTGDNRVNTTPGLYVESLLFVRLHNWICDQLEAAATSSSPTDEQLFQEARRIVIAIYQHVVFSEWLPAFIGRTYMQMYGLSPLPKGRGYFKGYDPKEELGAYNVASAAAMRVGHSLVSGIFSTVDPDTYKWDKSVPLSTVMEKPFAQCVDAVILGLVKQAAHHRGKSMSEQLTNYLFQAENNDFGADLCTININRGRDHGVPGYNKWRKWCGLSEMKTWNDAYKVLDAAAVNKYKKLYKHPDDIDLFSAGVSEKIMEGVVGPTFGCIMARSFRTSKIADRFWYENKIGNVGFTQDQLMSIKSWTFRDIICLLGDDISKVQKYVMYLPDRHRNFMMTCPDSTTYEPRIRTPWKDFNFEEASPPSDPGVNKWQ